MQELTTKLVTFIGKDFVLTIHRMALPCTTAKKDKAALEKMTLMSLVRSLFIQTIHSFDISLDELDSKTDLIEDRVFNLKRRSILREGYMIKRKISSYRKIFKFTSDILNKNPSATGNAGAGFSASARAFG